MAEYRPKHRGMERVLRTGSLFSTAYGNVGSSINYMFHCHVLQHEDRGMMGQYTVVER